MEHYITEIRINELMQLSNIIITLNPNHRQHLMITGKNGSGKTSLLLALQKYLRAINKEKLSILIDEFIPLLYEAEKKSVAAATESERFIAEEHYLNQLERMKEYRDGVDILFSNWRDLETLYKKGSFITAFFPASRKTEIIRAQGVQDIKLDNFYDINSEPGKLLHKYMVHLKTQQAYAKNEGDMANADRIQKWFDRFENALKILLDAPTITLKYDYREYDFKIHESGRTPFGFDVLSDGYSSVIHIVSDLILRMDQNWLLSDKLSEYDIEGIVLIDELETHLHIELQKKVMPFLTEFFPRIQFIVTTHSPYILNSISNAKAYDLERCIEMENLSAYSSDGLAEGYFGADEYSDELKLKIEKYKTLKEKSELTEDERAERAGLRSELNNIPRGISQEARDKFDAIEGKYI